MEEKNTVIPEAFFSEELLRFLFSAIKATNPFGLFFTKSKQLDSQSIVDKAKKEGVEKGILVNEEFTEKGYVYLRILEEYHKAERYCMVNNVTAALLPKETMILFCPEQDRYHMKVVTAKEFEYIILGWYPELMEEEVPCKEKSHKKEFSVWLEEHKDYDGKILTIGSYRNDGTKREEIFCWNETGTYRYQKQKGREKKINKVQILQRLKQVCNTVGEVDYV